MTDDVDAWIAAALYDPSTPDASERLELLRYLHEKGAGLDDMVASLRGGSLTAAASDRLLVAVRTMTREDVADRLGLSVDQIDRAWLSLGLPPAPREGPAFSEGDLLMLSAFALGVALLGFEGTLQFTRVMGSSLARIADAAVTGFLVNVEGPLVDEHTPPAALARASYEGTELLTSLPQIFGEIFRHHAALATMRTRATRDASRGYAEFTLSVGFLDLVGYTAWSRELSATDLARAVNDFEESSSDLVTERGARVVKNIGDAVMFVAVDPATACEIALDLRDFVDKHPVLTRVRGAVATGPLLSRDGDYFGPTVNLAARAVKLAPPGGVVVDRPVDGFTTEPMGPQSLRGIDDAVELYLLSR